MKHQTFLLIISTIFLASLAGGLYAQEDHDDALLRAQDLDRQGHALHVQKEIRQAIHSWKLAVLTLSEEHRSHRELIVHLLVDIGIAYSTIYNNDARYYLMQALKMGEEESLLSTYDARDLLHVLAKLDLNEGTVDETTLERALSSYQIDSLPEANRPISTINDMMQIVSIYVVLGQSDNAYDWQQNVVQRMVKMHDTGDVSSLLLYDEYEKLLFMSLGLNDPELTESIFKLVQQHVREEGIVDPKTNMSLNRMGSFVEFAWYQKTKNEQYLHGDMRRLYLQEAYDAFKNNISSFPVNSFDGACDSAANLSNILQTVGEYAQADQLLREAVSCCIASGNPRDAELAPKLLSLGQIRQSQGKEEEAYALWRRAAQILMAQKPEEAEVFSAPVLRILEESVQETNLQLAASINDYLAQLEGVGQ